MTDHARWFVGVERDLAAAGLGSLLGCVVVRRAERGEVAGVKEQIRIAAVRLAVVNDAGAGAAPGGMAKVTQGLALQLRLAELAPARGVVSAAIGGPRGCDCRA
jgi:hypothetical protein